MSEKPGEAVCSLRTDERKTAAEMISAAVEIKGILFDPDQITETGAEQFRRHVDDGGEAGELFRVLEIFAFEPDHVGLGAFKGFAVHVDLAVLHAAGLGVEHVVERQRIHLAVHKADDGAVFIGFGREQKFHRRITEVAGVFGVKRNRVGAAEFVAKILVNESHLDAELFETLRQEFLDQAAKFNFAEAQMAVVIADHFAETFELSAGQCGNQAFFAERFNQAFREDDEAII